MFILPLSLSTGGNARFVFVDVVAESEFHIPIGICVFFYLSIDAQFPCSDVAVIILQVYFSRKLCIIVMMTMMLSSCHCQSECSACEYLYIAFYHIICQAVWEPNKNAYIAQECLPAGKEKSVYSFICVLMNAAWLLWKLEYKLQCVDCDDS